MARGIQYALQQEGYQVAVARSGEEGLELLALNEVQVVVCDQRMPTMSGSQFLDRVKDLHPDTLRIIRHVEDAEDLLPLKHTKEFQVTALPTSMVTA